MNNKDPEHYDYDDDDYKNYPHEDYAEFYKKFGKMSDDEIQKMWQKWIDDVLDEIIMDGNTIYFGPAKHKDKEETKKFPVSGSADGTGDEKNLYHGMNHYGEAIWKPIYLVDWGLYNEWKNHMAAHAAYILKEPKYYRALYEIMN
jgi:hypothetical protein